MRKSTLQVKISCSLWKICFLHRREKKTQRFSFSTSFGKPISWCFWELFVYLKCTRKLTSESNSIFYHSHAVPRSIYFYVAILISNVNITLTNSKNIIGKQTAYICKYVLAYFDICRGIVLLDEVSLSSKFFQQKNAGW